MDDFKSSTDKLYTTEDTGDKHSDTEGDNNNSDENKAPMNKKRILCAITMAFANFTFGVNYSMIAPFFPQEAASKGMTPSLIGIVFSVYELVTICTSPIFGMYLVKLGEKRTFIASVTLSGCATISFGMLMYCPGGDTYIALCIIIRMIWGLGSAAFFTATMTLTANMFPDRLASMLAYMELAAGIGLMVGPPIGGFCYKLGGFKLPFIMAGLLCFGIGICIFFVLEKPKSTNNPSGRALLWSIMKIPVVSLMILCLILGMGALSFLDVGLAMRLAQVYNFSPMIIGVIFLVGPGVYAISSIIWANIADRKPHLSVIFTASGFFMCGIGYIFMGPVPFLPIPDDQLWLLLISLAMLGSGSGTLVVSFQVIIMGTIQTGIPESPEMFSAVSGIAATAFSLGSFTGPFVGGYLLEAIQFPWSAFLFGCVLIFYSAIATVYIICVKPCKETSLPDVTNNTKEPDETQPLVPTNIQ